MYDLNKELNKFYEDCVRLKDERKDLASYRDTNLERLKAGLKELGYPSGFKSKDQGSCAMYTINKHPEKKYDIDVAIIFEKDDLPSNPADARKRIESAMIKGGGNFSTPPEALTNAIRVSYAEGYHVDLALYRKNTDVFDNSIVEHAGSEWTNRDPMNITNWFISSVQDKSPSKASGATVDDKQLRRVVRWLKMFAKSRSSWNTPGGLIISALAVERYRCDYYRDDVALYETMKSIKNRLQFDKEVPNPVDNTQYLTYREKDKTRVKNLEEHLTFVLDKLDILFDAACTRAQALQAWDWVFQHSYWDDELGKSLSDSLLSKSLTVNPNGRLIDSVSRKDDQRSIPIPTTRFYGG